MFMLEELKKPLVPTISWR